MHIYISHREQDGPLAGDLAGRLRNAGFDAWNLYQDVEPGENWAKLAGKALERSEVIIFLVTPRAFQSEPMRRDFEFAITSQKHKGRVLSVLVGSAFGRADDGPWILRKLPRVQTKSIAAGFPEIVNALQAFTPAASK